MTVPASAPQNVCTRRFGDEYLSGYITPLTESLLVSWIADDYLRGMARLSRQRDLAEMQPLVLHNQYAYLNGAYLARMFRAVPRRFREEAMQGWFTPVWAERIVAEPFEFRRLLKVLFSVRRDRRGPIGRNTKAMTRHCRHVEEHLRPKLRQDYTGLSETEWDEQLDEAIELGREHFRVIRWGMGFHNPAFHGLLTWCLKRWADDTDGQLYHAIIGGLQDTETFKMNHALWELGAKAREDELVREVLTEGVELEQARARTSKADFWSAFDAILDRYGHRSESRDLSQPRWHEQPEIVLGLVRAHVRADTPPPSPLESSKALVAKRVRTEEQALAALGRWPLGRLKRAFLRWVIGKAQTFTRYRENQRHYLDFILAHIRNLMLEMGGRLVLDGLIETRDDMFYLTAEELMLLVRGKEAGTDARQLAELPTPRRLAESRPKELAQRREHWKNWKDRVPATFLFDGVETEGEETGGDEVSGRGVSQGVARGPARVLESSTDMETVQSGDILVVSNLDPAWTSIFPLIAGLVAETGGVLSHGAVLAREYGIPAVMGIPDANRLFPSGTHVEIDGDRGSVSILDS